MSILPWRKPVVEEPGPCTRHLINAAVQLDITPYDRSFQLQAHIIDELAKRVVALEDYIYELKRAK